MATYHAIAATGEAIVGLLEAACPKTEFPNAIFTLYRSTDFQNPMDEGISLYLYRATLNATRRNLPPRLAPDGKRYLPSLPVDLHYLLTPWAKTAARQQRLLGWSMRVLENTAILPVGLLNRYVPETESFRSNETVELVFEPLSLQEIVNIWDVFKPNLQLSVAYVVRMLLIDSDIELSAANGQLVQTREYGFGKGVTQ
jgi:hypothetical protein